MKFFKSLFFFTLFLLMPTAALAYFEQNDTGEEVFSFLSTFDSPRNASLEKSGAALPSTDPSIVQLNPAALRLPIGKKHVVAAQWQTGALSENQGTLSFTGSYKKILWQISYNWIDYGDIQGYNELGWPVDEIYKPFSQLMTYTISFPMKHINFGATLKFASDKLAEDEHDRTAYGAAFDWGISWISESKLFGLALVARDFGCLLQDYVDDNIDEFFPMAQTFALSGYLRLRSVPRLTLFGETTLPRFSEPELNIGSEYILGKNFFIRLGFTRTWLDITRDFKQLLASNSRPDESNKAHFLSAGLGYVNQHFGLDYSISYLTQGLGLEHRAGIRFGF